MQTIDRAKLLDTVAREFLGARLEDLPQAVVQALGASYLAGRKVALAQIAFLAATSAREAGA